MNYQQKKKKYKFWPRIYLVIIVNCNNLPNRLSKYIYYIYDCLFKFKTKIYWRLIYFILKLIFFRTVPNNYFEGATPDNPKLSLNYIARAILALSWSQSILYPILFLRRNEYWILILRQKEKALHHNFR